LYEILQLLREGPAAAAGAGQFTDFSRQTPSVRWRMEMLQRVTQAESADAACPPKQLSFPVFIRVA